jgi:GT2 family glycosyltransferase
VTSHGPQATPRFSVITTVYDPEPEHLAAAIESVDAQTTDRVVEHVIVDDGSSNTDVHRILDAAALHAIVIRRSVNGGIVAASNDALAAASGEFVVLLDHDDVLEAHALSSIEALLDASPEPVDVIYTDHDILRPDGRCTSPVFKPDFSLERLRNHNYITHLVVARRSAVNEVGGFGPGTDGAQDHDLLLRLAETTGPFRHLPEVLVHWRQSPASVATSSANKPEATDRACAVVSDHLMRVGINASVKPGLHPGIVRINRTIVRARPTVSLIIPTNGARGRPWGAERVFVHEAVASVLDANVAANSPVEVEVVAVIDSSADPVTERGLRTIAGDTLIVVNYDQRFNFSDKINVGVQASSGEYVLLLNDDTQLIEPNSIAEMVSIAQQPDVGMVGAKLLFADGTLQHGGHVYNDMITHALLGWRGQHPGPNRLLAVERECSGVTAGAALLRRSVFDDVGGMNVDFAINYNDVDLSLTLRRAGYRIIWTPHASWFHFEQQSGDHPIDPREIELIEERWGDELRSDPYYNTNFAPGRCDWLERPGRSGAPPYEVLADGRVSWG